METRVFFGGLGCECDIVSMGSTRVNTTSRFRGGVGGSRYHTGTPSVKLCKLRVSMTGFLTMPNGGKRKRIVSIENEPE